jgi:hypothetical protein
VSEFKLSGTFPDPCPETSNEKRIIDEPRTPGPSIIILSITNVRTLAKKGIKDLIISLPYLSLYILVRCFFPRLNVRVLNGRRD